MKTNPTLVVIKDDKSRMVREILVNGKPLYSITAWEIAPSSFNNSWNVEWRALLIMPFGFHEKGTEIL